MIAQKFHYIYFTLSLSHSFSLVFSRFYITLPATAIIVNSKSSRIKKYTWTRKQKQQTFRWLQHHHSLVSAANVFPIITLVCLFICLFLRLWLCGVILCIVVVIIVNSNALLNDDISSFLLMNDLNYYAQNQIHTYTHT